MNARTYVVNLICNRFAFSSLHGDKGVRAFDLMHSPVFAVLSPVSVRVESVPSFSL